MLKGMVDPTLDAAGDGAWGAGERSSAPWAASASKTSPRAWRCARFLLRAIKRVARGRGLGQGSEQALSMELALATVEADHIAAGVAGERFEHQAGAMQRRVPPGRCGGARDRQGPEVEPGRGCARSAGCAPTARLCRPGAAGPVGSVGARARRLGRGGPAGSKPEAGAGAWGFLLTCKPQHGWESDDPVSEGPWTRASGGRRSWWSAPASAGSGSRTRSPTARCHRAGRPPCRG